MSRRRRDDGPHKDDARSCRDVAILLGLYSPIAGLDSVEGAISKYYEEHGKLPANSSGDATPYTGATVTWSAVSSWLKYHTGVTLARFCEKAGFKDRLVRDHKELLRQRVQEFFDEHGRRPGTKEMPNENAWLKRHDSSLRKVCDELRLPGLSKLPEHFRTGRTEDSCRQELVEFYKEHGRPPAPRDVPNVYGWLHRKGISWPTFRREAGLPAPGMGRAAGKDPRTVEGCRLKVVGFYEEYGRRPKTREMPNIARWLCDHAGTSLQELCDELGIPSREQFTLEFCRAELRSFNAQHGRRPTVSEKRPLYTWLRTNTRYSLATLCDEMGLPGRSNMRRTRRTCWKETQAFYDAHGVRPRVTDLVNTHAWLYNHGSSLTALCDEMGLPPRPKKEPKAKPPPVYVMGRTRESCREELRRFYQQQGRPPSPRDVPKIYQWLHRHGIAWTEFCDDAGLPARKKGRPRVSSESW